MRIGGDRRLDRGDDLIEEHRAAGGDDERGVRPCPLAHVPPQLDAQLDEAGYRFLGLPPGVGCVAEPS